ncbi:MAG: hypothetical protein HY858_03365 [Candidatus Solibacter usitatus]|nr:hypothetical protein [Candidatus Solibacter usitatus]
MSRAFRSAALLALALSGSLAAQSTTPDVGSGSPSDFVAQRFSAAYGRNQFYLLTSYPPPADVQKLGTTGLIQLFQDAAKTANVRLALIKADANASFTVAPDGTITGGDVYQVKSTMWTYLASANGTSATAPANLNTTGYPTMDTGACAPVGEITCLYQFFDKKYVLFVHSKSLGAVAGQNFILREPYYTVWNTAGGLSGLGSAVTAEVAVTSLVSGTAATWQQYRNGAIVNMTSGILSGRVVTVRQPVFDLYVASGGPSQFLGLPVAEAQVTPSGSYRQAFEGGTVEYTQGGSASLLLPVSEINISGVSGAVRMKLGESVAVQARLFAANGTQLTNRSISWTTSNGRVAVVDASGPAGTIRAVGGGTAVITAVSEGKSATPITVYVSAPCCQAGEGAPTAAISQAITDAINRNRLQVRIPTSGPVRRLGPGYVQDFQDVSTGASYLVAVPEGIATGYVVRGAILSRYESLGGPAGPLGYPTADGTAGGRQMFGNKAALAGSPVRLVQGAVLDKWAAMGYEGGAAGPPAGDVAAFMTFTASAGVAQAFLNGVVYSPAAGTYAGRSFFVGGAFLATYVSLEATSGPLGMAVSDEVVIDGRRHQEFEGGTMDLPPGASEVVVELKARQPKITATPDPVTAGGRVRLAAGGFEPGDQLRITVTGQPDFLVTVASGAFAWEVAVPTSAASSVVSVRAVSTRGPSAAGSYRVRSLVEAEPRLVKAGGDAQTGVPGALLPEPLRIVLRDAAGHAVPGVPIVFQASLGASIERADPATNAQGEALAYLRLPESELIAGATATAASQVVTFLARSAPISLPNFPKLRQSINQPLGNGSATIAERGALLASLANMLRFHQDRGDLPVPNGPADVAGLNNFLRNACVPLAQAAPGAPATLCDGFITPAGGDEQFVNLWRIPAFTGGAAEIEQGTPELETVRDWIAGGAPILVALRMQAGGQPAGMHFVVATGVAANGGIPSFDPGDYFGRNSVNDFLSEFQLGGVTWSGALASVIRLAPRPAPGTGFLVRGGADFTVAGPQGACGAALPWLDRTAGPGAPKAAGPLVMARCDGAAQQYQLGVEGASQDFSVTTLASPATYQAFAAAGPSAWRLAGPSWTAVPQFLELDVQTPPVNAANLLPELAPGSLMTLFGAGLSAPDAELSAEVGGVAVPVVAATPFRANLALPADLAPGPQTVRIQSPLGQAEVNLDLLPAAPAIFVQSNGRAVVLNEDGRPNSTETPARRGRPITIHATGLGALSGKQTALPLAVFFGDREVAPLSVAAVSEVPGVYVVQVTVPQTIAPGLDLKVQISQAGQMSQVVSVAIE